MRLATMSRTCLLAALLLTFAGCGAASTAQSTAKPTVRIISPVNGTKLSAQTVTVRVSISHFTLVPGGTGQKTGTGQVWIYVNGQLRARGTTIVATMDLAPGAYTLKAALVTNGKAVAVSVPVPFTIVASAANPSSSMSQSCQPPQTAAPAGNQVRVSLPIQVLPTDFGVPTHLVFPKTVSLDVPVPWARQVAAYGVSGCWVILAPIGWTGSGEVGVDGTASAHLHATATAAIQGSLLFSAVPACEGCAFAEANLYFPDLGKVCQQAYPGGDCPSPIPMRRDFLKPGLLAYSLASTVNGVAETTLLHPVGCGPWFAMEQVSLPPADVPLETVILNYFISITSRYY